MSADTMKLMMKFWYRYYNNTFSVLHFKKYKHVFLQNTLFQGAAGAQGVEWVVQQSQDWWFDPWLLVTTCQSVLEQDLNPQFLPEARSTAIDLMMI